MITETVVTLTKQERAYFQAVDTSIGVGFPGYPYPKGDEREAQIRALRRIGQDGHWLTHEALSLAIETLEIQVAQCAIEADVEHWRRVLLRPTKPGAWVAESSGGAALVTDPERMCEVLAESRSVQLREAMRALDLARQALALTSLPVSQAELDDDGEELLPHT